jgi:3-oxoacyl-[acyl-carrier-protein] synthase III
MEKKGAGIVGTGLYLPKEIRTNEWFKKLNLLPVDNDILDNAGVLERRICAKGEKSSDMETKALLSAVEDAGISVEDIELILDGSYLHDQPQPGNASLVQYKSGAKNAAAINVETACTSLLSQMVIGWGLIKSGVYNTVACIVSSNWTQAADYTEKSCMLMGDGAVAVIMQPLSEGKGILSSYLETDGSVWGTLGHNIRLPRALLLNYKEADYLEGPREKLYFYVDSSDQGIGRIKRLGPVKTPDVAKKALNKAGYTEKDIDFLITHNPSIILTDAWRKALHLPENKQHITLEQYGNMAAASLGANLHEAVKMGKIKAEDIVVLCGPGTGHHHAAVVMRWGK